MKVILRTLKKKKGIIFSEDIGGSGVYTVFDVDYDEYYLEIRHICEETQQPLPVSTMEELDKLEVTAIFKEIIEGFKLIKSNKEKYA